MAGIKLTKLDQNSTTKNVKLAEPKGGERTEARLERPEDEKTEARAERRRERRGSGSGKRREARGEAREARVWTLEWTEARRERRVFGQRRGSGLWSGQRRGERGERGEGLDRGERRREFRVSSIYIRARERRGREARGGWRLRLKK
ncbi:hypothetical protein OIU74_027611 [Salix koriyanagi]|uniref:Uncharacterized protein n=1 Tax=Salix koriyanagi TaxID=2511006 RepID=A0A9Q0VQM1_9ROSI|nr:hypothetical protein OIU74_027611 [Salix koriyanagi]